MRGQEIILASNPKGVFLEGQISGTPYPGTVMEIKNTAFVNGRPVWQVWSKATGAYGLVAVLLPDNMQGALYSTAYVDGAHGFLYCPVRGEELNMRVTDVAGTADDVAIGALFSIESATGQLIANSANVYPCFTSMEVVTDPAAAYWLWVTYNG